MATGVILPRPHLGVASADRYVRLEQGATMSTPYGGGSDEGLTPPPPPQNPGGFSMGSSPGAPPPPPPSGDVDYSQIQPHYGQPYGGGPQAELAGFWIRFLGS